jgi:hypothetical protein
MNVNPDWLSLLQTKPSHPPGTGQREMLNGYLSTVLEFSTSHSSLAILFFSSKALGKAGPAVPLDAINLHQV